MNRFIFLILVTASGLTLLLPAAAEAQLQRERVDTAGEPVGELFPATMAIGLNTVRSPSPANLNTTVLHTFGQIDGGIERFFGLDDGANTRIGVEYGFSERFSAGLSRMTFDGVVNLQGKALILRQTGSDSTPVELALNASAGVGTRTGSGWSFGDRTAYSGSLLIARKFERFSLQASPTIAHFSRVGAGDRNTLFAIGLAGNYRFDDRFSLTTTWMPVVGERNPGTHNTLGISLDIDTGGHIFQLFLTSAQWHNEAWILAHNRNRFLDGEIRFGFNIHRTFGLSN